MNALPVVLITGSGRGLGQAFALTFAEKTHAVALHFNKDKKKAEETAHLITKQQGQCDIFGADVRSSDGVNKMVAAVFKKWGRLDVLINNAGLTQDKLLLNMRIGRAHV